MRPFCRSTDSFPLSRASCRDDAAIRSASNLGRSRTTAQTSVRIGPTNVNWAPDRQTALLVFALDARSLFFFSSSLFVFGIQFRSKLLISGLYQDTEGLWFY